jgi:serine/threonine-protein kinase
MALADRYDLVELLGEGSFGQVFRALDRVLGRTVAIKVLHRQDDDARRRFHREAVVLHSQLANEFVVGLLDHTGLNDEDPYLVLEFCELKSLRRWVGAGYGWKDIATALLHAARGLAGLHAAGGLHRDIKPENMLQARAPVAPGWKVKLADFGLAGFPHPVTGKMTRSAGGTEGYIAPEVLAGAEFHSPADVYSLGIVAVEMLVGRIDSAPLLASGAPTVLKSLLQSMVSGRPEARPTARAVAEKLKVLLAPVPALPWILNSQPPVSMAPVAMQAGSSLAKGAAAVGLGVLAFGFLKWISDRGGSVGQDRGPDGRFR